MIKDKFSYSSRWDSIGLDCAYCRNFQGPIEWPDVNIESKCLKHDIYLSFELGKNKYKEGEWFCKHFENNGHAAKKAESELNSFKNELDEKFIYGGYGNNGYFKEVLISKQKKIL